MLPSSVESALAPEQILAVQFAGLWHRRARSSSEALAVAVLAQAIDDLRVYGKSRDRAGARAYLDAYRWVLSTDRTYVFSFINVCEFLGLSPQAIRRGILARDRQLRAAAAAQQQVTDAAA
jgi:hypothetical protein